MYGMRKLWNVYIIINLFHLIKLNTLMVSDNKLNEDYISISGKNPPSLIQLQQIQSATVTMDVEKE